MDSLFRQFSFGPSSDVFPRHTSRLAGQHPTGSPLDFSRPRGFNFSEVLRFGIVETGEELGRDIGAFSDRQGQGFTKNFLRSGGHTAILDPVTQPKRLHPTAA